MTFQARKLGTLKERPHHFNKEFRATRFNSKILKKIKRICNVFNYGLSFWSFSKQRNYPFWWVKPKKFGFKVFAIKILSCSRKPFGLFNLISMKLEMWFSWNMHAILQSRKFGGGGGRMNESSKILGNPFRVPDSRVQTWISRWTYFLLWTEYSWTFDFLWNSY